MHALEDVSGWGAHCSIRRNNLYRIGYTKPLQSDDLWPLIEGDKADVITAQFEAEWAKELRKPNPEDRSLKMAVWRTFRLEFIIGGLYKLINDTLIFSGPLLLNLLIRFISTPEWPLWYGVHPHQILAVCVGRRARKTLQRPSGRRDDAVEAVSHGFDGD